MSDLPRSKYKIIDLIFTFYNALCMSLGAIILLSNFTVILVYIIVIVLLALIFLFLWIGRNPFNFYLVRAFAFNNLFFTSIALLLYYFLLSFLTYHLIGYILFLLPSVLYLKFSRKSPTNPIPNDEMEEKIKREKTNDKLKKQHRYKLIIFLANVLTSISFIALIYGFY